MEDFYNILSVFTKKCSLSDRVGTFKNVFSPKNLHNFPSPSSILQLPNLTKGAKTGYVYLTILQHVFSLMEIENQNIIESLIIMVTEIKETVHSLSSISVVNSTHHSALSLFKGKHFFCI